MMEKICWLFVAAVMFSGYAMAADYTVGLGDYPDLEFVRANVTTWADGDRITFAGSDGSYELNGAFDFGAGNAVEIVGANGMAFRDGSADAFSFYRGSSALTLSGMVFSNFNCSGTNRPSGYGGAIYCDGGTLSVSDAKFIGNHASLAGGALYPDIGTTATVSRAVFSGNSSGINGGAILAAGKSTTISDCDFFGNTAASRGGAVYVAGTTLLKVSAGRMSEFSGNTLTSGAANSMFLGGNTATTIEVAEGGVLNMFDPMKSGTTTIATATKTGTGVWNLGGVNDIPYVSLSVSDGTLNLLPGAMLTANSLTITGAGKLTAELPNTTAAVNLIKLTDVSNISDLLVQLNSAAPDGMVFSFNSATKIISAVIPRLEVSDRTVGSGGATFTLPVYANMGWSARTDAAWLSLITSSGTGNGTITVAAEANNTGAERSGTIILTGADNRTVTGTVLQFPAAFDTANVRYVDAHSESANPTGENWTRAFPQIQSAIDNLDTGIIFVASGTYAPIVSSNKLITIRAVSENQSDTIIDAKNSGRSATLGASASLTNTVLHGFTLRNADTGEFGGGAYGGIVINCSFVGNMADRGGGAYNRGKTAFTNSLFAGNSATNDGGTMFIQNGTVTVSGGVFSNNHSGAYGGAIENSSSQLTVTNGTLFTGNSATYGGAICNKDTGATTDISGAIFTGNSARFYGGAINNGRAMTICDSDFIGNSATNYGGAIRNDSGGETLTLRVSAGSTNVFSGNTAAGVPNSIYMNNGTLTVDVDGTLNMFDPMNGTGSQSTTIIKTGAGDWNLGGSNALPATSFIVTSGTLHLLSGAFLSVSNLTLEAGANLTVELPQGVTGVNLIRLGDTTNVAELLAHLNSTASDETVFSFNSATKTICAVTVQLEIFSGTVGSVGGNVTLPVRADIDWTAETIASWLSVTGTNAAGVTVTAEPNAGAERTASVILTTPYGITATGTVIQLSAAIETAGVRYVDANTTAQNPDGLSWATAYPQIQTAFAELSSGAIYVAPGEYASISSGGDKTVTIRAVSVNQSDTIIDGGNTGRSATLGVNGTALNAVLYGFTLKNGNTASPGGGGTYAGTVINCSFVDNTSATVGGALHSRAITAFTNSLFTGNSATSDGGALYLYNAAGSAVIDGGAFSTNSAGSFGGAIFNTTSAKLTVTNGTVFAGNRAGSGGAIYNIGGTISNATTTADISGATFTGNTATTNGGAIYNDRTLTIRNADFINNSAGSGGAIYNFGDAATADISGTTFAGNTSVSFGGAIYNNWTMTIRDADFINNSAGSSGGAICGGFNTKLTLRVSASSTNQFSGNTARGAANSIYMNGGTLTVDVDGTLNMYDPMYGEGVTSIVIKTGAGVWNLGGSNALSSATLTVGSGTLNLLSGAFLNIGTLTVEAGATLAVELPEAVGRYDLIQLGTITAVAELLAGLNAAAQPGVTYGFDGVDIIYADRTAPTTSHGVPYWWLEGYGFVINGAPSSVYEAAAERDDVKGYPVWHDYVSGVNPTDSNDYFTVFFTNSLDIAWAPDLSASGRVYNIFGRVSLTDTNEWSETTRTGDTSNRFFHVTVELEK